MGTTLISRTIVMLRCEQGSQASAQQHCAKSREHIMMEAFLAPRYAPMCLALAVLSVLYYRYYLCRTICTICATGVVFEYYVC